MSSIANFTLIETGKLDNLKESAKPIKRFLRGSKDFYYDFLKTEGKELKEFNKSGYIFGALLPYLQEKGVDLMKSEYDELADYLTNVRGSTIFILTKEHKDKYLSELESSKFDIKDLEKYYEEFYEEKLAEAGQDMLDGVIVLHENLKMVEEGKVIIFGLY